MGFTDPPASLTDYVPIMAEPVGYDPTRRYHRPTPLAGAPLQPAWVRLHMAEGEELESPSRSSRYASFQD